MTDFHLVYWHWYVLGMILVAAEIFVPSTFIIWFGLGGLVVGTVTFIFPDLSAGVQILLFGLLSAGSLAAWIRYDRKRQKGQPVDTEHTNIRTSQYTGQIIVLATPLENGVGRAKVGDSTWSVSGTVDLPEGTRVRVIGADGIKLLVEPVDG